VGQSSLAQGSRTRLRAARSNRRRTTGERFPRLFRIRGSEAGNGRRTWQDPLKREQTAVARGSQGDSVEFDSGSAEGNKKTLRAKDARRVSESLLRNSKSSLAVFYVEQVALNRHVADRRTFRTIDSPPLRLLLLSTNKCPLVKGKTVRPSLGVARLVEK